MPPQPVIPNWVRVIVKLAHEGNTMIIGVDWKPNAAGPYTGVQLSDLLVHYWTNFGGALLAGLNASWSVAALEATDRSVVGGAFASYVPSGAVGTGSGDALPANCALCVSKRTGFSGRRNHGRLYFPGMGDINATGSTATPAYSTVVGNFASILLGLGGPPSLFGKWAIPSVRDLAMKTITSVVIDQIVDSQRRRLPGRGF